MAQVIYVACPQCRGRFYVGPEFFSIPESYCHCPYCETEFSVFRGIKGKQSAPGVPSNPQGQIAGKM